MRSLSPSRKTRWASLLCLCCGLSGRLAPAVAVEHVELRRDGEMRTLVGEVIVSAKDGSLLLRARDNRLWLVAADELVSRRTDDAPFQPLDPAESSTALRQELGQGFQIHTTAHYVIAYNTSQAYAEWCGALYERLYRAFYTYWDSRGFKLKTPDGPLVALVFDTRRNFLAHARRDMGTEPGGIIGYYNVLTNRVSMYDLTGVDGQGPAPRNAAHVNQILMQPQAERTVATIVHEATHQLAYNSGLQTRLADNPFWVSEGLAVFFETPDLRSSKGWRGVGEVNLVNLAQFQRLAPRRPADSLATLLGDDSRFRSADSASDAYAEAWALNYYLLRRHKERYVAYLKSLAARQPTVELTGEERQAEFVRIFGDLAEFDRDFMRYMSQVR